jgi:hypothetical protein
VTRSSLYSGAKESGHKTCAQLSLSQNPLSESEALQSWGCSKILLSFFMRFDGHFWPNQQQQQWLPRFESILYGHLSRHLLPAIFRLKIENTTQKRLINSELHFHNPFVSILVFLSQTDRLWNKLLWQLCSFPPPVAYKEFWLYKTSYNSHTVEDKQTKLSVWTDVSW